VSQLKPLTKRLKRYFDAYGGWRAIWGSPLFHLSVIVGFSAHAYWVSAKWVDLTFSLIPSLLGFSLGTYAILFSLITNRMRKALRAVKNSRGISYLEEINATFFHFIFMQTAILFYAFLFGGLKIDGFSSYVAKVAPIYEILVWPVCSILSAVGMILLVYAVSLVVGAALTVYRLALITDPED
jgi:hypothetical protein